MTYNQPVTKSALTSSILLHRFSNTFRIISIPNLPSQCKQTLSALKDQHHISLEFMVIALLMLMKSISAYSDRHGWTTCESSSKANRNITRVDGLSFNLFKFPWRLCFGATFCHSMDTSHTKATLVALFLCHFLSFNGHFSHQGHPGGSVFVPLSVIQWTLLTLRPLWWHWNYALNLTQFKLPY